MAVASQPSFWWSCLLRSLSHIQRMASLCCPLFSGEQVSSATWVMPSLCFHVANVVQVADNESILWLIGNYAVQSRNFQYPMKEKTLTSFAEGQSTTPSPLVPDSCWMVFPSVPMAALCSGVMNGHFGLPQLCAHSGHAGSTTDIRKRNWGGVRCMNGWKRRGACFLHLVE